MFYVSTRAEKPRGKDPRVESGAWLDVSGDYDQPIRDVRSISITVHPESEWTPWVRAA